MLPAACIFDMDELLLASVPQWRAAIEQLLEKVGVTWTPELAVLYQGMNVPDVARVLHQELKPSMRLEMFESTLRAELLLRFERDTLLPMPGAVPCVQQLSAHLPCAVASGSPLVCIETAMNALGISTCFQTVLSSESVARGKPHPDVFLAAAKALGVEPGRCVVFEDSLAGVRAAHAAAMKIVAVPSGHGVEEIKQMAHLVFASLEQVTMKELESL